MFVADYHIVSNCVWPMILHMIDTQLSFCVNQSNLKLFRRNFASAKSFLGRVKHLIAEDDGKRLIDKFNLQTYANLIVLELSDKQTLEIERLSKVGQTEDPEDDELDD
jgi:hypothetical protein